MLLSVACQALTYFFLLAYKLHDFASFKLSCVYCCSCLVCIVVSCLVCIVVVVLCVLL